MQCVIWPLVKKKPSNQIFEWNVYVILCGFIRRRVSRVVGMCVRMCIVGEYNICRSEYEQEEPGG